MVCRWYLFITLVVDLCVQRVFPLDNGVSLAPPMGWMTWGRFKCSVNCDAAPNECISESLLLRTADKFVAGGYADAGYQYIIVDDCWMKKYRNPSGRLVADEMRFSHGMPSVSQYVHKLGLLFGIYTSIGVTTCMGYAGSKGFEEIDAKLFAEWEVDYLKLDGCFVSVEDLDYGYPEFSRQLNRTGRPIVYSCSWPYYKEHIIKVAPNYKDVQRYCNLFRTYHDIQDSWSSIKDIIMFYGKNHRFGGYGGPGHWNDADMLMIGNGGLNVAQSRVQMAIWSILAAPLIMSNDLNNIKPEMKEILLNAEVIAVDQDPLGVPGQLYKNEYGDLKIWRRMVLPIMGNYTSFAVAFVNMNSDVKQTITVDLNELELPNPFGYTVFDLYANNTELVNMTIPEDKITITVPPTDVIFYKFQVL